MGKIQFKSVEDVSVIRKFSIFFLLLSVVPFVILVVLFFLLYLSGDIQVESRALIIGGFLVVGFFMAVSFFAIRNTFSSLNKIAGIVDSALKGGALKPIDMKTSGDNEIAQITRSFNEVVNKLEASISDLEKSKTMLQEVLKLVSSGISATDNFDTFMDLVLETTVGAVNAETGAVLIFSEDQSGFTIQSTFDLDEQLCPRHARMPLENETVKWVMNQKTPLVVSRLGSQAPQRTQGLEAVFQPPFICAPLLLQNKVLGALAISSPRREKGFVDDELIVLTNIASQVALAIDNTHLHSDVQKTYLETINALAMAVEARDQYSRGHSDRVGEYAVRAARKLGLSEKQVEIIKEAAVLHDVGKIGIGDSILLKPGKLTDMEWAVMQQHPLIGEGIIIPLHNFANLRDPIRHHHERLDGTGYPDHLKGDQVSIEARLLSVADAYDAMTSKRPYRDAMSQAVAFEELNKYKETRYDPVVVDVFISCFSS